MRGKTWGVLGALAVVGLSVAIAGATTVRRIPLAAAARQATLVVVGTVESASCRRAVAPGGATRTFTDYDLRDVATWKGSIPTANLVVSVIGGSLHGRTLSVPDAPRLEEGRRYLLLLDPARPLCPVVGWSQGVFRIEDGPDGVPGVRFADGRPVAAVTGGEAVPGAPAMPLAAFLEALDREGVREAARAAGEEPR